MFKIYNLNPVELNFGIPRVDFINYFETIVLASSKYNEKLILDLLKHDEADNSYNYADENLILYRASEPTLQSSVVLRFIPKLLFENDQAMLYLNDNIDKGDDITSISYILDLKNEEKIIVGLLVKPDAISTLIFKGQQFSNSMNFQIPENLVFMNRIDKLEVNKFFNDLSKWSMDKMEKKFRLRDKTEQIGTYYSIF